MFYSRPYPISHKLLQCSGVLFVYLYQILPVLKNLLIVFLLKEENSKLTEIEEKALFWHSMQFFFFLLSGLIFVGRIPERFYPGVFDLVGQSHHGFHLTIFFMAYSQSNAVFQDIRYCFYKNLQMNFFKDFLLIFFVFIIQLIFVFVWFRFSRPKIEKRYQIHSKKHFH